MKNKFELSMVRGKRRVYIGAFPSRYRAENVACNLEWDPSWKAEIKEIVDGRD